CAHVRARSPGPRLGGGGCSTSRSPFRGADLDTLTAPGPGGADHTTGAARVFDYPLHRVGAIEPSKPKDHARTVAILGAAGQLGTDLVRAWGREHPSDRVVGLAHGDVEVGDPESVR